MHEHTDAGAHKNTAASTLGLQAESCRGVWPSPTCMPGRCSRPEAAPACCASCALLASTCLPVVPLQPQQHKHYDAHVCLCQVHLKHSQ